MVLSHFCRQVSYCKSSPNENGLQKYSHCPLCQHTLHWTQRCQAKLLPWCERGAKISGMRGLEEKQVSWSSVQFSRSVTSNSLWPHGLQHTRPPCPSPTPEVYSNSCPLSRWCHPSISSSVVPFSSTLNPSQHQGLFKWVISSHQVAKVLELQLQHQSFQWTCRTDFL